MTTDEKTDAKTSEAETKDTPGSIDEINQEKSEVNKNFVDENCSNASSKVLGDDTRKCQNDDSTDESATKKEKLSCDHHDDSISNEKKDVEMKSASLENLTPSTSAIQSNKEEGEEEELVTFKLTYLKVDYNITFGLDQTILKLKEHIQSITSVAPQLQKLILKGGKAISDDDKTLRESGIISGAKVLLVGSKISDVFAVNLNTKEETKIKKSGQTSKEPLCKQKQHKKIIDKGVPVDAMPAWRNGKASLPPEPLYGMVNKYGNKVRLTFKLEQDQLWVGTKERTDKLSMVNVRSVISEPIEGHEEYHIMAIQTGPTEASRIWVYWVPAQYIDAIKNTILGK